MERIWLLIGVGFALSLIPAVAARSVTLYPSADTYVDNSYPYDSSGGTSPSLYTENSEDRTRLSYLMFDLSNIPPNADILSAKLYLYLSTRYSLIHPRVFRVLESISETMYWNNRPSYPEEWYAEGVDYGGEVFWDVMEAVRSALSTRFVSFCLAYTNVGYSQIFYSKESVTKPSLEIEYNTPPEIGSPSVSPSSGEWGTTFNFSVRCSDPDGDPLDVALIMDGRSLSMHRVSYGLYELNWTSEAADIGTRTFYFEASDGIASPRRIGPFSIKVEKKSTSLNLSVSSSKVHLGSSLRLQGAINPPLTGAEVKLTLVDPKNVTHENRTSTQNGQFSFLLNFTKNDLGRWRAVATFEGNEYYKPSTSSEKSFEVLKAMSAISARVSENLVRGDRSVVVSGTLDPPGQAGEEVVLSFLVGGSRFEEEIITGPSGSFSFRFEPSKLAEKHGIRNWTGEWRVTASWRGSETYSESQISSSFVVLAPLWVEQWFPLVSALSAGLVGGLAVAVIRARRTYAPPPPSKSKERLVFEVREG